MINVFDDLKLAKTMLYSKSSYFERIKEESNRNF